MNMRAMQGLVMGLAAAVTLGCATHAVKVRTDVDPTANVGRYITFFMEDGNSTGDKAIDQQIKSDVESALARKGWIEAPPDEGQAIVIAHAVTGAKQSASALYAGWGGWQWHIGGPGAAPVEQYQVGSVVVDIFDARTRQAIWRGVATDAVPAPTPAGARAAAAAIDKMFMTFPRAAVDDRGELRDFDNGQQAAADQAPRLIFSSSPAVLVSVRGEPLYREIAGTPLKRVINTRALIVCDDAGVHYMWTRDGWMEADALTAWWSAAGTGPEGAKTVLAQTVDATIVDPRGGDVYVTTTPAALIVTDGEPRFAPVNGTSLVYVTNTTAHIFREPTDQELYVLVAGRWLRAWTTAGPFQYVPTTELPADFTRIPGDLLARKQ